SIRKVISFFLVWINRNSQENLNFVKSYQPRNKEVKHLRILLIGPVGSGKSSFINSVDGVFQDRITGRAAVDAVIGGSVTNKYKTYKIRKDPEGSYSFIFNDTMGFERSAGRGVHVEDIKLALKGHVKEDYEFNPKEPLTGGDFYNPSPTLGDRVHVLVSVVPADKISLMSEEDVIKLREVRLAASAMNIPQLAIITKIDEACPKVRRNIKNAYWSKVLKEKVDRCSSLLGIPPNCIFLVKNYSSEITPSDDINALILVALRQMVCFGEDFLKDLQD
ncbi:interferon-induced protein 44-like, partial [Acanthochromis polyacanthus]|uniref:interferon-induced protein 44-like n=1 Tax=Acanthochromis polyacanthus TaxID=80966 RepID=UPI00223439AF